MSAALLEIDGLTKSFGGIRAVRECTFSVPEGHVIGLIGPNGAGKSTVVDLVSGFTQPDAGSVRLAGEQLVGKRPDVIARLGLIRTFQTPREWRHLTVMDNVLLARCRYARESLWRSLTEARRIRRAEDADRVEVRAILQRFQLADLKDELAVRLSGGQKRLLEFARIAAAEPRLIILDEPMGGVNPVLGARIGEAVGHFAADGRTVIVVEHNLPFIERTCDQVVVMDLGEVIAQGPFCGLREIRGWSRPISGSTEPWLSPCRRPCCGRKGSPPAMADPRLSRTLADGPGGEDHRDRGTERGRQVDADEGHERSVEADPWRGLGAGPQDDQPRAGKTR